MNAGDSSPDIGEKPEATMTIDVVALMEDLRRRVAEKKAAGLYTVDALAIDRLSGGDPIAPEEIERLRELSVQKLDLTISPSTKPGVGRLVTKAKRILVRGSSEPLIRASAQSNEFNVTLLRYIALLSREIHAVQGTLEELQQQNGAKELEQRLRSIEATLNDVAVELGTVRRAALTDRLGRLEHLFAQTDPEETNPAGAAERSAMVVKAEKMSTDGSDAHARWSSYAARLGSGSILQLGAGSGRALEVLGPEAHGVESDPDLVAVAQHADRAVELGDPLAHLTALADQTLERVLVTDLVEALSARELTDLAGELARCITPGGHLIVEGANPTTLTPGIDWSSSRALGRPRHPDVIQVVLEGAGFASTQVTFPTAEATHAVVPPTSDPALQAISRAVQELSANVYGPSHYAVHAIR